MVHVPCGSYTEQRITPGAAYTWRASSPGVATVGTHRLQPNADCTVALTRGLHQSGAVAPIVAWFIGARTRRYVQMEADGFTRRCEAGSPL